jgi:hypothetical protein
MNRDTTITGFINATERKTTMLDHELIATTFFQTGLKPFQLLTGTQKDASAKAEKRGFSIFGITL